MGPWRLIILFLHLILHVSSNSDFAHQTANVKGTVMLQCEGAISEDTTPKEYDVRWMTEKNILVAHYQQGELTAGEWFKGRLNISESDIRFGNFSLKISPVEYSDEDLYMCFWRGKHLGDVNLEVLVPTKVSAPLGEPVILPCYFHVDKMEKMNADTAHWEKDGQICGYWKKDGQTADFQSGSFNKSCGCENRCSMSVDRFRFGDLSLNIPEVRHSDQGTYRCFGTEKTVRPDVINLTIGVHHNTTFLQRGQSLWLKLYSSEPVRIVFQPNENPSTVPVCTVKEETAHCEPQYQHRVSIQNKALILHSVTPLDKGVYRVIDHMTNENISVTILHTPDPPATAGNTLPWMLGVVLLGVVLVLVVLRKQVKSCSCRTQRQPDSHRSREEDTEPQPEMASLVPGQPVQENGEEEQLRAPVCESGDTEDKHGPQPWNDDDS